MHKFDTGLEAADGTIVLGGRTFANRADMDEHFADLYELDDYVCTDFRKTRNGGMTFIVEAQCSPGTCGTCG